MVAERGCAEAMYNNGYYAIWRDEEEITEKNFNWILDSGASSHMSHEKIFFEENYRENDSPIIGGNGMKNKATRQKDITITVNDSNNSLLILSDTLLVPELVSNIISIPVLSQQGYRVQFSGHKCQISKEEKLIVEGHLNKGHYVLSTKIKPSVTVNKTEIQPKEENINIIYPEDLEEPEDWKEVKKLSPIHQEIWKKAMYEEMDVIKAANTWKTTEDTTLNIKDINPLPTRWIYKIKYNDKNKIVKIRARLVVKGCNQKPGKEFSDTFAPVVNHTTIRTLLTIAGKNGWNTKHCDVSSAFLYGELKETLYIKSPAGPWENSTKDQILLLNKAMYGLKQAAKSWNDKIHGSLIKMDMERSEGDPCLYYNKNKLGQIYIIIHVDDLLMTYDNPDIMENVMKGLKKEYQIKDLGEVSTYLGINITRVNNHFQVHQRPKIIKLINDLRLSESQRNDTPMITGFNRAEAEKHSKQLPDNQRYQEVIGSLMYLSNVSRPDIAISTNILGRSVSNPTQAHWEGIKRIIKYLNKTKDMKLDLNHDENLELKVYCDSDWGGDLKDRRSTSGAAFFLGKSLIGWFSRKQKCVALSSAEAEYVSLFTCLQ